jgi:16S rRNA (cytosine1402-N4)-methyltransferase
VTYPRLASNNTLLLESFNLSAKADKQKQKRFVKQIVGCWFGDLVKNTNMKEKSTIHIPVLLSAVLQYLDPKPGETYLDLTAGYGGHAAAILERTLHTKDSVLVDRDQEAVEFLAKRFAGQPIRITRQDYASAAEGLVREGRQFDMVFLDLGVSSPHLDRASRGFSIRQSGPLDMRMDQTQDLTAYKVVNRYSEADLQHILHAFGEEPRAKRIAKSIVAARPIASTDELATIVAQSVGARSNNRIHPATRTFQAIRIAVNDELEQLRRVLRVLDRLLAPGGRLGMISFHSLEDRLVKQFLDEHAAANRYDTTMHEITKKPVVASEAEIVFNPRARSAKLRVAVKNKNRKEHHLHANKSSR